MEKLWTRCEDSIPRPCFLSANTTNTYYVLEYVARGSYQQYPDNSRILNFKMSPEHRNGSRWRYKQDAIKYFADRIMDGFNLPIAEAVFVPMPTSKPRSSPKFDSRLEDVLQIVHEKTGQRIGRNLGTIQAMESFHHSDSPRRVDEIALNIDFTPFDTPIPSMVVLIDDVVTTGAHFLACSNIIKRHHADIYIVGLFFAKTIWPMSYDDEIETKEPSHA